MPKAYCVEGIAVKFSAHPAKIAFDKATSGELRLFFCLVNNVATYSRQCAGIERA
jgi:hypothetical protein